MIRGAYGILYAPSMLQAAGTSGTSGTEGFTGGTALNTTLDSGQTFIASLSNPFPSGLIRPLGPAQGPISGTLTDIGGRHQDSYFVDYVTSHGPAMELHRSAPGEEDLADPGRVSGQQGPTPAGRREQYGLQSVAGFEPGPGQCLLAQVPNPFYGIIQNPTSIYAKPTIQANYLLSTYPQYTGVSAFRKPMANSNFQSGIFSVEHRYKSGLRCWPATPSPSCWTMLPRW